MTSNNNELFFKKKNGNDNELFLRGNVANPDYNLNKKNEIHVIYSFPQSRKAIPNQVLFSF